MENKQVSDIEVKPDPEIRIDFVSETIDIFGGSSHYTEEEPYYIRFDKVNTVIELANWMAHLSFKSWWGGENFAHKLARTLTEIYQRNQAKAGPATESM